MSYCNKTVQFDPYTFWLLTGKEKEKAKQYCEKLLENYLVRPILRSIYSLR